MARLDHSMSGLDDRTASIMEIYKSPSICTRLWIPNIVNKHLPTSLLSASLSFTKHIYHNST